MIKAIVSIFAVILTVIGVAGYFFLSRGVQQMPAGSPMTITKQSSVDTTTSTPPQQTSTQTVIVTYDDNGFSPKEVIVPKGSTVQFVNKSSIPMWVASDPHPAHTDYPEFDTFVALKRYPNLGENFQFTFTKVGTWKYHSHAASGDASNNKVHPAVVIVK